ncbi:MAG: TauD/TfdA family dioxygenase [Pseudomonadota bacterium]
MSTTILTTSPIPGAALGATLPVQGSGDTALAYLEANGAAALNALHEADGLLVVPGWRELAAHPDWLVRISRVFGPEVENYHDTLTPVHMIHPDVGEILVLSNAPPCNQLPPPPPEPPRTAEGALPITFPHRRGWHTDQSFRRPPPDISLFYAVTPAPLEQAQTLFANGYAAYDALGDNMKAKLDGLMGLHALLGTGRSEKAVLAGETPQALLPHQRSQAQPVVRRHPVTGRKALYLCEGGQMDWLDGPFIGMEPGPEGEGAQLLYELMAHYTRSEFVYAHEWNEGDLLIYDNRSMIHSATWYDAERHHREMWRTTVHGNPGPEYAGESKSWMPADAARPMDGLVDYKWR